MNKKLDNNADDDGPGFVGIKFCTNCNNMTHPKENREKKVLTYECRHCGESTLATNNCTYANRILRRTDEIVHIKPEIILDPTLPRTNEHPCPKCKKMEAVFFQPLSLRAEDVMRLYYVCLQKDCGYMWTDEK